MNKKGIIIGCSSILLIMLVLAFWLTGTYNHLVQLNENVNESWSQVDNQYQRRYELIPNLVNTVRAYADFERGVLTDVTEARARVGQVNVSPEILDDPQAFQRFEQAQGELRGALSRLLAVVENYPELKANENFIQLQVQLEGTENRISVERRRFNQAVRDYNTSIKTFPNSIFAGIFGFSEKEYFRSTPGSETAPRVEF
jgi:LemA protein